MKKTIFTFITILTALFLIPNVISADSVEPSVSLTPNKAIYKDTEVILEVNYGSEVTSMYFDVETLGFCTLFDCGDIVEHPRDHITIDGNDIDVHEKAVSAARENGTNNLQISISDTYGSTKFKTVQIKTKATSNVTRTTIKVSNLRSISLPQIKGKSALVEIEDLFNFTLENNGEKVNLSIPRWTTLKEILDNKYYGYLEEVKSINEVINNEKFAKFINTETGEDYNTADTIDSDITVKAVYYISLTIDGKEYDDILDNSKLADLYELVPEKEGYKFTGLVKEDGKAATDADVVDNAVFKATYRSLLAGITPEIPSEDNVVTTDSETYDVLQESLLNTSNEELQNLIKDNDVTVELKAEETTVDKDEMKKFAEALPNATISKYLDISVLVKSGKEIYELHELDEEINLTVKIPTDLPEVAEGYTRTYYILREHDGKVERLETLLSEDGTELSFATDKFSTYVLAYEDQANAGTNPDTFDNIGSYLMISAIACTGLVALGYSIKKKLEN